MAAAQHAPGPPIAVLGSGSWGTALALLVARNGYDTWLWSHEAPTAARMHSERRNPRYLSEFPFPDNLTTTASLRDLVALGAHFLVAVPSHAFRTTLASLKDYGVGNDGRIVAWGTKGLEPGSGKLLELVAREVLGEQAMVGLVSGPTFAREVARGLPTAITAVSHDADVAETIAAWLRDDRVRVYTNDDVTGVQLGGAIKNVMAIAAGISDGLGFGANARAALITRGLAELTRLGVALGGRAETFMGLTGVGDLILTCTDDQSRNRRVGLALGAGRTLEQALGDLAQEAEGVNTARELYRLAGTKSVDMPITEQVYRVLYEGLAPAEAVEALLSREPKKE
jgi:glycerol-3-phosphate dehydrogenase (NAD(P)+)